jgi:hypothetical protein
MSENTSTAIVRLCRVGHKIHLRYGDIIPHAAHCPDCGAFVEVLLSNEPRLDDDGNCVVCRQPRGFHTIGARLSCGTAERVIDAMAAEEMARGWNGMLDGEIERCATLEAERAEHEARFGRRITKGELEFEIQCARFEAEMEDERRSEKRAREAGEREDAEYQQRRVEIKALELAAAKRAERTAAWKRRAIAGAVLAFWLTMTVDIALHLMSADKPVPTAAAVEKP